MTTNPTAAGSAVGTGDSLALSVHGPAGVLDLLVPTAAVAADVAEEYARQAGLQVVPTLCTPLGALLEPDLPLAQAGVAPGGLLIATDQVVPAAQRPQERRTPHASSSGSGALAAGAATLAAAAAALAGWCAATASEDWARVAVVDLLVVGALVGVLPVGRHALPRVVAAPAFAAAAAFALAWDPHPERWPMLAGVCGLAAAVAAAVGRALGRWADEALQVWIVAGSAVFGLTGLCALAGAPPRLPWAALLVLALLAARFVPGYAVDVPDQYLIDLERLAVTAWSARTRPGGKRGRSVVPEAAVAAVAERGTRLLTAASAAILVVAASSSILLLHSARLPIDRIGARCLVGLAGAGLLLAARSYRHTASRTLLRLAGLACWVPLVVVGAQVLDEAPLWAAAVVAVVLAIGLVVVAVAVGRGWRSAWWSRRAEVAEGLVGALALASLVVASGWFRELWEITSLWELGT
ncbi:hypothetical protein [Nocardioides mangrovi]|uniref:Type VII secretion integral membrane protein EccD n=1 Tax=Nocardioides mangrovi TaxID=2874580 RepID=A0ABS7UDG0_9ACTN|nr:hypothetical protein [Nocardioides mangrovi]MBZ5739031.1 hypothetical protein [Nocardioides mangrovi]